ncbi:28213_t:CDS:2, partial [Gigaspora margarita]
SQETGIFFFSKEKRPQSDSQSSSKEHSKSNKSVNLGSKAKYTEKENISQTDLLQEILERLNCLEISKKEKYPVQDNNSQPEYKGKHKSKKKKRRSILHTSTIQISKLYRKLVKMYRTSEFTDSRTLLKSNQIILEVNTKLDTQIQALLNTINKECLDDLKGW